MAISGVLVVFHTLEQKVGGLVGVLMRTKPSPSNPKDSSKTCVDECLDLLQCRSCGSP